MRRQWRVTSRATAVLNAEAVQWGSQSLRLRQPAVADIACPLSTVARPSADFFPPEATNHHGVVQVRPPRRRGPRQVHLAGRCRPQQVAAPSCAAVRPIGHGFTTVVLPLIPLLSLLSWPDLFDRTPKPKIMGSILENVGNTPMVRLNKLPQAEGLHCEVCMEPRPIVLPSPEPERFQRKTASMASWFLHSGQVRVL